MGGEELAEDVPVGTGPVDGERLQAACAAADVHPLLCAVAHLTGDLSLLREGFAPDQGQLLVPGCGLGPEEMAAARALAAPRWRITWPRAGPTMR